MPEHAKRQRAQNEIAEADVEDHRRILLAPARVREQ